MLCVLRVDRTVLTMVWSQLNSSKHADVLGSISGVCGWIFSVIQNESLLSN